MKIDKRKKYVVVLDTETANTLQNGNTLDMSQVLVYDCGWVVCDTKGNVYAKRSYLAREIFCNERDLMQTCYYKDKISKYIIDISTGERKLVDFYQIKKQLAEDCKNFGIKRIYAHNAFFDYKSLTNTQRYLTKSKYRYFFPYDVKIYDTLKLAKQVVATKKSYIDFCSTNGYLTNSGKVRLTAEILYRFITQDIEFVENHTGLEDVLIEKEILAYCYRQHKKMNGKLFND